MPGNQAPAATAPRAPGGDSHRVPTPQQQDRFGCESTTAWSPASPSHTSSDLLSASFSDAIEEAAALCNPTMRCAIDNNAAGHPPHHISSSGSNNSSDSSSSLKSEPRADDPAMMTASTSGLDRGMMGMLTNNWNLNAGPPRAPTANWGFEPTPCDSEFTTDARNRPVPLAGAGSMMMTAPMSTGMTQMMGVETSGPRFASGGANNSCSNNNSMQLPMTSAAVTSLGPDPFSGMDNFVMPYQDCATLPVSDFPLYDGGGIFNSAGIQCTSVGSQIVNNQLNESSVPYFGNNGPMMTTFQQPMFNEVAQPLAASMAAINGGFAMPDLSLQEDDDSDWNGSSSGFSTVSSSPIANNPLPALSPTNATVALVAVHGLRTSVSPMAAAVGAWWKGAKRAVRGATCALNTAAASAASTQDATRPRRPTPCARRTAGARAVSSQVVPRVPKEAASAELTGVVSAALPRAATKARSAGTFVRCMVALASAKSQVACETTAVGAFAHTTVGGSDAALPIAAVPAGETGCVQRTCVY
ncbi:unnamed protein product [Phytophthora fragariaefolia]|uniref:Unnamed protein product n=1 Tax=Phytophthora fragariaefolia TaxID=1490495 RepID=A0A9W6XXI0_9STRA|nr:unnamed protein product [Phytophthora fragariaefolia]